MHILVTNDDGVNAPGIRALANEMASIANITVVAPDRNRSGASNSLTLTRPLRTRVLDNGYHSVEGTPTDCVHLALTGYIEEPIAMVVSGINDGANLGDDVLYSGTVAAAMEGRNLGLPALAFSMVGGNIQHYDCASIIAKKLVLQLSEKQLPAHTIMNVNVPDLPLDQIKGMQITRLGTRHSAAKTVKQLDPRGRPIYWIGPPGIESDAGPGTDFYAIANGYVSITPLQLDMTHYKIFDALSGWIQNVSLIG